MNRTEQDTILVAQYDACGFKMVRLGPDKRPIDNGWPTKRLPLEEYETHVRKGGGLGWQVGEPSDYRVAVDSDWPEMVAMMDIFLSETLRGAKGSEESHRFYRSVGLGYKKFAWLGSEIGSIKASNDGAGHQVAVAPTVHKTKGHYRFVGGFNPATIAELPPDELRRRVGMLAAAALVARLLPTSKEEDPNAGGRHEWCQALAGFMLRNGESVVAVKQMLIAAWSYRKAPPRALEDIRKTVEDSAHRLADDQRTLGGKTLKGYFPELPAKIADFLGWERSDERELKKHYARTDLGNAERFVDSHGDRVLWCPARKSFLCWDGKRFAWDERGEVIKLAHQTARSIFHEAAHAEDEAEQKNIAKWALASQNEGRINAMLSQSKPYLVVGMEELDHDPWRVNCQNGTLDLRTGKLKDHDTADRITKIVPVDYASAAPCPRFERFLQEALVDDAVIRFVKRYAGYSLTGITRERLLAILYGFGKNGKTTLVELIHEALGDYARNTDVETLLVKKYQGVGNDVAALKGARFVSAAEVEKGRRLAESKIKQLTGRDTVTARFLFGEPFDFKPEFKLWLSTNNKPVIQGTDDAIWDRLRLIPFTQRFEGSKADPLLADKLKGELAGVFAWMVAGCLEWQEHGLQEPETVTEATNQYREEMDTLAAFIEDRCVLDRDAMAPAGLLYKQYQLWCDDAGERKETQKVFGSRLRERGFESVKIRSGPHKDRKGWLGIGVRADHSSSDDPTIRVGRDGAPPTDGEDGPLDGDAADDGPRGESTGFAGKNDADNERADHSGPKNQHPDYGEPREEEDVETRSAWSASSAETSEEWDET